MKTGNWRQAVGTASTHWLNSLSIWLALALPGPDAMWKLRLLSVLSWGRYCFSVFRLASLFRSFWTGIAFFGLALLNPFLIFYFSLARGYAPACAFVLLALWLSVRLVQKDEWHPRQWLPAFIAATLAVAANFTALYFFLALAGVFLLYVLLQRRSALLLYPSSQGWMVLVLVVSGGASSALFFIRRQGDLM